MKEASPPPEVLVEWPSTHRIIRSRFPRIDLFEDIADPADWEAILSAEEKTNPRLAESVGMLDLIPKERRISGHGASWAMAPFVHVSHDRKSRFSDGSFGVYYAGDRVEVALFETIHHHTEFMGSTDQPSGWTSEFRELIGSIDAELHDISKSDKFKYLHDPDSYANSQLLAADLKVNGSNGLLYNSVRFPEGKCIAVFWPDVVGIPVQAQHFSYYWDGSRVSQIRNLTSGEIYAVEK